MLGDLLVLEAIDDLGLLVDVMAEVPAFVKQIVAAAAGTKPYIYQVSPVYPMIDYTTLN